MKAIIKRITKINGDTFYKVFVDDEPKPVGTFYYSNEISEKMAMEEAMKAVKAIENGGAREEIIYETLSDNVKSDI